MNGTITFNDLAQLADFLKQFTGSTATFTVVETNGKWTLTFNGGF